MIDEIKRFAEENELIIGICGIEKIPEWLDEERPFHPNGFPAGKGNLSDLFMPGAQSVLVAGLNLYKTLILNSCQSSGVPRGRLSFVALGTDYHRLLREKLQALAEMLLCYKTFQYKIHVDTGPLPEKNLAVAAGLGFRGKNSLVISSRFGSFFAIGLLVLDIALEESGSARLYGCGSCTKCIDACPTGALSEEGLDWRRCISYLTQSKILSAEQEALFRKKNLQSYLYGCDCCQLVCPYNRDLEGEVVIDVDTAYPALYSIANMSRSELKERFEFSAAGWRLRCVKRNAEICLSNRLV